MSLKQLTRKIQQRSGEMDRQCRSARSLLNQQKAELFQQASKIPLPAAMAVAFVGGFVAQRFVHTPMPSHLLRLFLTWRAF